jgi:ketosteroid isomerase-like protein
MSERDVEILRRSVDHFNATGEFDYALVHPEVVFQTRGDLEGPTIFEGIDGHRRAMGRFADVWSEIRLEVEDVVSDGDPVVAELLFHLRGAGSGVEVDVSEWWVFWLREGQVTRIEQHGAREAALAAASEEA